METFFSLLIASHETVPMETPEWGTKGVFVGASAGFEGATSSFMTIQDITIYSDSTNSFVSIFADGIAEDITLKSSSSLESGDSPNMSVYNGGVAKNISVIGNTLGYAGSDDSGHRAIYANAFLHIENGGSATNITLQRGSVMTIEQGGVADGVYVGYGASLTVKNGGRAINVNRPIFGGVVVVEQGGTVSYV